MTAETRGAIAVLIAVFLVMWLGEALAYALTGVEG